MKTPITFYARANQLLSAQYGSTREACKVTFDATKALAKARELDELVHDVIACVSADDRWCSRIKSDELRFELVALLEKALGFVPELPFVNF